MICGLLLAAGSSRRFGACDKLLEPLADGTPLVVASARVLLAALPRVYAVVRPQARQVAALLETEGCTVVECPQAARGMGASLACGVRASPNASAWLIMLGDMPLVRPDTVRALVVLLERGAALAVATYRGRRGHPVGFSREFGPELMHLDGDRGARQLLERNAERLVCWHCEDAGVVYDVDSRTDLRRAPT